MNKRESLLIIALKIVLILSAIVGGLIIGFCRVPNQNIELHVYSNTGEFTIPYTPDKIKQLKDESAINKENNEDCLFVDWSSTGATDLKEIKIFRHFKSIVISKITRDSMGNYGYYDANGIHFNQEGIEYLYNITKTILIERIVYSEILGAFIVFLWILVNALKEKLDITNKDNHGPIYEISLFFKNLSKYKEYIVFAAKADLNAEVANSYLNRLWWILEPFCNMLVYVIVFGRVMGNSIERYATFVFSALIMWNYFNHIVNFSVKCVRTNRDIVTKIYVPKYVLLLTNMVLNFIKLLFSMAVLVVMLIFFKTPIGIQIVWVIPSYLLMLILSFGIGMVFVHYGVFIDDLAYAVTILLTLLMFLSGVFYDVVTTLSEPLNHILISMNPVAIFIDSMRNALLYQEITNVPLMIVWMVLGTLICYIGIHIVNKNENGYVKVI